MGSLLVLANLCSLAIQWQTKVICETIFTIHCFLSREKSTESLFQQLQPD